MLDSLAALVITFMVMSIVSLLGVVILNLIKNEKIKKVLFYFFVVWAMIITYCGVLATPPYLLGELVVTFLIGGLAVAARLIKLCGKSEKRFKIARILVSISVVVGMIDCFMI